MSQAKTQTRPASLTEREKLARDLFIQLAVSPVTAGRDRRHIATTAIELAEAFFAVMESRKE